MMLTNKYLSLTHSSNVFPVLLNTSVVLIKCHLGVLVILEIDFVSRSKTSEQKSNSSAKHEQLVCDTFNYSSVFICYSLCSVMYDVSCRIE